jgi:hypothetical protein
MNSALHPIIEHLQRAGGFKRDDNDEQKLAKLEELLARSVEDVQEVAPLFAALLSIPTLFCWRKRYIARPEHRKVSARLPMPVTERQSADSQLNSSDERRRATTGEIC